MMTQGPFHMTLTLEHAGAPHTALKLSSHRHPQGQVRVQEDRAKCSWLFVALFQTLDTHIIAFSGQLREARRGQRADLNSSLWVPQNFSKLTELYNKRELLLGRAQRAHLIQPIHFQRRKLSPEMSVDCPGSHSVRHQNPKAGSRYLCKAPHTATRQVGESWH